MSRWSQEENTAGTSFAARLPALCSRLNHRPFTRERETTSYTNYTSICISFITSSDLLLTKKQSISNRPLWPSFSAPFLSLIYPWVFSTVFLYRGYSATRLNLVAYDSTNSLDFSNLRRLILPREIVQEDNLFFAFIKRYVIFYLMNKTDQEYDMTGSQLE